jgi:histidine triad (HIT) family protein
MTDTDCIFCKIIAGAVPSTKIYEDDLACAFEDSNPKAPKHVLVMPREHLDSLNDAAAGDQPLLGHLLRLTSKIANQLSIAESGYRIVINTGPDGGQSVEHLHLHLLGGRPLAWPPG